MDLTRLDNSSAFGDLALDELRAALRAAIADNLGDDKFIACYDSKTGWVELVFTRYGDMGWFGLGVAGDESIKEFAREFHWRSRLASRLTNIWSGRVRI